MAPTKADRKNIAKVFYVLFPKSTMNAAEAVQLISEMTGINRSEQQVRAFMKRHGLKFIKCGHIAAKADNEAQNHGWKQS
jgi:transposase